MSQPIDELWLDFSPRTNLDSVGHYLPLHLAWSEAAKTNNVAWQLISGDQHHSLLQDLFNNMYKRPAHFKIINIREFLTFLKLQNSKHINLLVYEGEFVAFYFLLFISKFYREKITIHFNWSNNNQLEKYSRRIWFKAHFAILDLVSKRNFIHYVENEPLVFDLNCRSRLSFERFPTSTVFDQSKFTGLSCETNKLALIINDKSIGQSEFCQIVHGIEAVFSGHSVVVHSYTKFEIPNGVVNIYKMCSNQIDSEAYFEVLKGTWISFFFYNEENYKYLTSGRFLDCLFVNSLICVPKESTSLDWLGEKFGNLFHVDLRRGLSSYDIELLFHQHFKQPEIEFTPNNLLQTLMDNTRISSVGFLKIGALGKSHEFVILFGIFICVQSKFFLLLVKKKVDQVQTFLSSLG
jgi:hypothetical protein